MNQQTEQMNEAQQKSMAAALQLTQLSLENSKRILEVQVETARTLIEEGVKNAQAISAAKDPQKIVELQTLYTQETAQKMMESMRRMGEITSETQASFNEMIGVKMPMGGMAGMGGQDMMGAFQKMMSTSGMGASNQNPMAAMQQTFETAKNTYEQMLQASTAAFTNMSGIKK